MGRRPFADSKWYQKFKQQILQGLRRGTSLRETEELSVEKDNLNLQIGVMTDMIASSTNPSVSAIANTSLAALYTALSEQTAPNCCNASAVKQFYQLKREFSNPRDLHSATLLARVIASERKSSKMSLSEENDGLKSIMRCILALPDIHIAKMHAWQYNQLWEALSWCKELYSPDEQEELLSTMLDRLLQSGEPTLQQDLIVYTILSIRGSKSGVICTPHPPNAEHKKDPAKIRFTRYTSIFNSSISKTNNVYRLSANLSTFISFFPDVINCAMVNGQKKTNNLLTYLSRVGVDFSVYHTKKEVSFNSDNVNYFYEESNTLFEPLVKAMYHVHQICVKSFNEKNESVTPLDPLLRLSVISKFHDVNQYKFEEAAVIKDTETILHWSMLIKLDGDGCPESASLPQYSTLGKHLIEALFPAYEALDPAFRSTVLKAFTSFVTSKKLNALPPYVLEPLYTEFDECVTSELESEVTNTLNTLFQHFVSQDPQAKHASYPMEPMVQNDTLTSLVKFACEDRNESVAWKTLLLGWIDTIDKMENLSVAEEKLQKLTELRQQISERLSKIPTEREDQECHSEKQSKSDDVTGQAVPVTDQADSIPLQEDSRPTDKGHSDPNAVSSDLTFVPTPGLVQATTSDATQQDN